MNICSGSLTAHVVPDIDPKWGGTSVSVPALTLAMHALDSSLRLYFAADRIDPSWPAFYRGHLKSIFPFAHHSESLRNALRDGEFSLIHHHALWLPSLGYSFAAAQQKECPLVISPHGMLSAYSLSRARVKKWLARHLLHPGAMEGAAAWRATCEEEFREIRAAGYKQQVAIIPNGIEVPVWDPRPDREAWLGRHPELEGKRLLLFYSRLHSKKGVLPLLEMWADIHRRHGDWHLLLCGSPHEYRADEVRAFARSLGVAGRTTVADASGLPKPYPLAELFVLPTRSENFGLVIGEALSVGVPVLTSTEAPWEKVNTLECGRCVPLDQFSRELDRILSYDSETLGKMGKIGEEWVRKEYSWSKIGAEMLDFYRSLI